jgi:hypothetical protein
MEPVRLAAEEKAAAAAKVEIASRGPLLPTLRLGPAHVAVILLLADLLSLLIACPVYQRDDRPRLRGEWRSGLTGRTRAPPKLTSSAGQFATRRTSPSVDMWVSFTGGA